MKPATSKLLFIGNSFTARNDLPGLITGLAASADPPRALETRLISVGGASLKQHWNGGAALAALRETAWDCVVLQEQSTLPIKSPARFHDNVRLFDGAIRERGAKTVLYLTWARRHAPETQAALDEATRAIASETGALVAPAGPAWAALRAQTDAIELYDADGSHPSPAGSYLAACVFVAALFGIDPVGLAVPETLKLGADAAAQLQRVAGETVAAWTA